MTEKTLDFRLAIGAIAAAAGLWLYLIPTWISAPGNIRNIVLSPLFWPQVLAGLLALTGLGLLSVALKRRHDDDETAEELPQDLGRGGPAAFARLGLMALIMIATMVAIPRLGMVWTCMLAFIATAFLIRTRHPVAALVSALAVPLVLYAFFAHVAGIAIPQGDFVRLP